MRRDHETRKDLRREVEALRMRLEEAEEALRTIRSNLVDGLMMAEPEKEQSYTLKRADQFYRVLFETMTEHKKKDEEIQKLNLGLEQRVIERTAELDAATKRLKESEQKARLQLAELETIYDSAPVGLCVFDPQLTYLRINKRLAEINGVPVEEHIGRTPWEVVPDLAAQREALLRQVLETGQPIRNEEISGETPAQPGMIRTWLEHWLPLKDAEGHVNGINVVAEEITDRKQSEHHSNALNFINLEINSRLEFDEIMRTIVTEAGKAVGCETAAISLKKDDHWILSYLYGFPQELVGTEMLDEEEPHALMAIRTKEPVIIEDAYNDERVNPDHMKKYGVRSVLVIPILAGDNPIGVIFFNDHKIPNTFSLIQVDFCLKLASSVSFAIQNAQLLKELKDRAQELEMANKELEAFTYSVSHDLKNPLIVASGFCRRLSERYAEKLDDRGRRYIQRLKEACQQMNLLIEDLLELSKATASPIKLELVDVSDLVKLIAAQLKETHPGQNVTFLIEEGLTAKGDSRLLRVALENLLGNAWKFTIQCERATIEFGLLKAVGEGPTYFVRDNGCGFDMSMADKLFKPFQRLHTDEEFSGTGVGLATVHRIITRHGGRIWAESEVGKGTTFFFTLPTRSS
jgi:PAS domain S-box-containing protein